MIHLLSPTGFGSKIDFAVDTMVALGNLIATIKRRQRIERVRLLDVPCGDMTWMRRFLESRDDVDYTGIDIVPELIAAHKSSFGATTWKFEHRDIITDGLPVGQTYNLILCRSAGLSCALFTIGAILF